jgi:Coenzyme PQQ synthesis protein D (PqqD)
MAFLKEVVSGRVRRSSNVVSRVVADEAIVVPIRRGAADLDSIYTFNEAGTKLWSLIEKGLDPAGLISHLQSQYGLSTEQATLDAQSFLRELYDEGLVEPA